MWKSQRLLFGSASLLSALGGLAHAAAYGKAATFVAASNLPRFYAGCCKGLWLADSTTLFILAALFGFLAVQPAAATRSVIMLVSLIPAATAIVLYIFLGNFFAGHLLLLIAVLGFLGSLQRSTRSLIA